MQLTAWEKRCKNAKNFAPIHFDHYSLNPHSQQAAPQKSQDFPRSTREPSSATRQELHNPEDLKTEDQQKRCLHLTTPAPADARSSKEWQQSEGNRDNCMKVISHMIGRFWYVCFGAAHANEASCCNVIANGGGCPLEKSQGSHNYEKTYGKKT